MSLPGLPVTPASPVPPGSRRLRMTPRAESGEARPWYREKGPVVYIYIMWAVLLTDPHRWIAALGILFFHRVLTLLLIPVIGLVLLRLPVLLSNKGNKLWYGPLLSLVLVTIIGVPVAVNHGVAQIAARLLVLYYIFGLAVFMYIDTARRAAVLVTILLGQYIWWAIHANVRGVVPWHPDLANSDGFGPLALLGLTTSYFWSKAARTKGMRRLGLGLALWSIIGIVAAFARGVMLAMVLVAGMMWVRSPKKGRMTLAILGGLVMIVIGAQFIVPTIETGEEYLDRDRPHGGIAGLWTEFMSSFSEGSSEGTGNDRWELWKAALIVFKEHPIIGAGAQNVGIAASEIVQVGEIGSIYAENPARLWGRQLHNIYFQILSEFGLLGSAAYLWILIDFWIKNKRLMRKDRCAVWDATSGGQWNLYYISLGLELTMVAFLATGFFYNTLYLFYSYALIYLNRTLYLNTTPPPQPPRVRGAPATVGRMAPGPQPGVLQPAPFVQERP